MKPTERSLPSSIGSLSDIPRRVTYHSRNRKATQFVNDEVDKPDDAGACAGLRGHCSSDEGNFPKE